MAEHCSHAEAKGLVVGWEGKSNGLPLIRIDRDAMTAAVGNLIGNAIKYSPAGTRIEVKARMDNGHATIEVADEGPGIDRDDQRRIFRRFQRGKNTLDVSGSGLGLALVRATVEAHHGAIDVESAPGKGSKFTITLPSNS